MKFCEHVPNSLRNKTLDRLIPNLLEKVVFLGLQNIEVPLGTWKRTFFFNFECYDLANGIE
jgi:hypothetical protein